MRAQSSSDLDIKQLSVAERLDLISALWDSIPNSLEELPIPEWHRGELERRLAEADANPDAAIPWDEVRERLRKKS
ncbi:MAG TPA: addiction module protein [Pyrinomonadaceae bacterium]|nr:addiction module protein [Pyrinomonadaceae bacterium]